MKKNLIKGLFLSLSLIFASCNENDNDVNKYDFGANGFVSFASKTEGNLLENATTPIKITALASVPNIESEFTVDLVASSTDATASDYIFVDGKTQFTFGPDKFTDTIEILPVNNVDPGEDKTIILSLSNATNGSSVDTGRDFTLTLIEDDCPFTIEEIGQAAWSGSDNVPSGQAGPNTSEISTSFDGTNVLFKGIGYAWLKDADYWNEVITNEADIVSTIDPLSGEITIEEQYLCSTTWKGDPQADYSVKATGVYVACSGTLTLNYDLIQNGSVLRSFTDVLTKN